MDVSLSTWKNRDELNIFSGKNSSANFLVLHNVEEVEYGDRKAIFRLFSYLWCIFLQSKKRNTCFVGTLYRVTDSINTNNSINPLLN